MQKIVTLLLFLSFNFVLSQNSSNYMINYKLISLKKDLSFFEKIIWEEGLQYTFFSNKNICFLTDFQIKTALNVNMRVDSSGPTTVYLNYKNDRFYYDLNGKAAYNFKIIKFEKIPTKKSQFMGFNITKYKSMDGNIEILTTKELPWYVQPCACANNSFDGAILKLINYTENRALVLIDYEQMTKVPSKYEAIAKKIKNHSATKVKTIDSPFLTLTIEEEKYSKKK